MGPGTVPFEQCLAEAKLPHAQIYTFLQARLLRGEPSTLPAGTVLWTGKATVPQLSEVDYFSLSHQLTQWAQQLQRTLHIC